ncbi:MAG: FUSC family protein [Oscillospiraceae bacterium]
MKKEKLINNVKLVFGKIVIFAFCIGFISWYNLLFGSENSIVGIVLLMSLLMFLEADFGISPRDVMIIIPTMFACIGAFAKISLVNPFVGLVVNAFIIGLILVLTRKNQQAYLPFLMGYIMFRGYDTTGLVFYDRMISLVFIGGLIGIIYLIKNRNKTYKTKFTDLFRNFDIYGHWERWAILIVFSLVITGFITDILNIKKYMWVELTVLSLITPIEGEAEKRKYLRIPATILGCVMFFALFEVLIPPQYQTNVMLIAGFLSTFITSYFIKTIYNSFSALVTAALIFPVGEAITMRIFNNIIGAILAVAFVFIFTNIYKRMDIEKSLEQQS